MNAELRGKIRAAAAELRKCLYGPQGFPEWGTKFVQIEDDCCEIGDALTAALLEQSIAEQAQTPPSTASTCSKCRHETRPDPDDPLEPRPLQTSRGEIAWQEPKRYCAECRQDFFPSELRLGPGRGGYGQS